MSAALEPLAKQLMWAAKNTAHNIDFIPEDKFDWKPAPTAASALEIINHVLNTVRAIQAALEGSVRKPAESEEYATNREEAKHLLLEAARNYAACLHNATAENLDKEIKTPLGVIPMTFAAGIPVTDLIHHHGQIAYIQTLLGDTESHFRGMS